MPWFCWFLSGVIATLIAEGLIICGINWISRQTD